MVDVFDRNYYRNDELVKACGLWQQYKFLKPYCGEKPADPRVNGKHEHYTNEYNRLNLLLREGNFPSGDQKVIEKEIEKALKFSLESI